ncbi:MAG: DUF6090 family protein [Flavobacteriaceae bacterium]
MLRFFRKLRKKLLKEKKISHYFFYALGEIVLIVIGILIALAINNWNIRKQQRLKEAFYLEGLQTEFEVSKNKLVKLMEVNRLNFENSKKIAGFLNAEILPQEQELSLLIYESLSNEISYNPNNSLLDELLNTGGLTVISQPELRKNLTAWESFVQSIKTQEQSLSEQRERVVDILRKEGSIRTGLDEAGVTEALGLPKGVNNKSNLSLLQSEEFENELLLYILNGVITEQNHYNPLLAEIEIILGLLNQQIEQR